MPGNKRFWDGQAWTQQANAAAPARVNKLAGLVRGKRPLVLGGLALLTVVVLAIAIMGAGDNPEDGRAEGAASAVDGPVPMMDPAASQAEVVASIQSDFCPTPMKVTSSAAGFSLGTCYIAEINEGTRAFVMFRIYGSAQEFQIALDAGSLLCESSELTTVAGPSWMATALRPADAASLVDMGARVLRCGE